MAISKKQRPKVVERAIASYYSSLSEKDLDELREWGEFSLTQFSTIQAKLFQ